MPRASWALVAGQPVIQIELQENRSGSTVTRTLLADTGGGSALTPIHLALSFEDVSRFGGIFRGYVGSGGAIEGNFRVYAMDITIPELNLVSLVNVMAVPAETLPDGLQGIVCFRFLNSFNYGNGGNPAEFVLESI